MKLTHSRLKELISYDPETGEFTWLPRKTLAKHLWNAKAGTYDKLGYLRIKVEGVQYLAHRLAFLYMTGEIPEGKIDHKDTNPSNCAWDNLREATSSQNSMNSCARADNQLGMKNIRVKGTSFQVRIGKDGKSYTKTFKTLEEAIEWRDTKLLELHGDFANNGEAK